MSDQSENYGPWPGVPVAVTSPTKANGYLRAVRVPADVREASRAPAGRDIHTRMTHHVTILRADALQPNATPMAKILADHWCYALDALEHGPGMGAQDLARLFTQGREMNELRADASRHAGQLPVEEASDAVFLEAVSTLIIEGLTHGDDEALGEALALCVVRFKRLTEE